MILRTARRCAALAAAAVLVASGCSGGDEASTCSDLQDLASEVRGLQDVDLIQTGTEGLEQQIDEIESGFDSVKESGSEQFGDQLDALEQAVSALGTTLSEAGDGGQSISGVIGEVEEDVSGIATAWTDLTDAVDSELGDCDLTASDG